MVPSGDVAVVIPARNESDRIRATVTGAAGLPGVDLVLVVDDGSRDGTAAVAQDAGASVVRHSRSRGKAAAMESGAEAVRLLEARDDRPQPRHLLFLDGDLGQTAAAAAPLTEPVLAGEADMTIAVFADRVRQGGHGFVVALSGAGIERATGWRPAQPLNGQRCLTRAAFEAARPLAPGFGVETALTIDLVRRGMRVREVEVPLAHRATGTDWRAQIHRARQFADVAGQAPGARPRISRDAGAVPRIAHAARPGIAPEAGKPAAGGGTRAGRVGLAFAALSIAATIAAGLAGPSAMEPVLPGRPGEPPWAFSFHLSPYVAVGLTAAALAAGTAGLGLCLHALRRGWTVSPRVVLAAGLIAAAVITLAPPFGSSDQLSYAAYGRMVITGHDPYLTTPAMLARLGDPVARAVQDWRGSPSVYGSLATGGQALASWIGEDSVRLTVFVLSLLGLAAFAGTGLLLHLLTRGSRERQLRAGLLWTLNPLLLQVLVAGAHVDSQAIAFAVAAVAVFALGMPNAAGHARPIRRLGVAVAAGAVAAGAVAGPATREAHRDAPAGPRPFRWLGVAAAAGAVAGLAAA